MLDNVRNLANNNISNDDARIKSSDFAKHPSFKGNPNAVDNTPTADTYSTQLQAPPPEMSFGQKFLKYIIPTWGGLHLGTTLYNHANSGEYEKSLVGRLGKLGDKLSQTSLIRNSFVDNLRAHGSTIRANIQNFIDRHPTLSAMQKTPTKPESSMVTNFLETQNDADLKEASAKLKDFMEKGESAMHPMVLNDVAVEISMHESTISRITTEKYIHTPKGTFELKYFFSSSVNTESGGSASSTAIKAVIKEIISKEPPRKPLSDSKISDILNEKGLNVARRTVTKYRESLGIPSTSQRKQLI